MYKVLTISTLSAILLSCGASTFSHDSPILQGELEENQKPHSDPNEPIKSQILGATTFEISILVGITSNSTRVRKATFDGNGTSDFKDGCIDGNSVTNPIYENRKIKLQTVEISEMSAATAAVDLADLAKGYYSSAATSDEMLLLVVFGKDTETFKSVVALQNASGLPPSFARFLQTAARLSFIPGGNFSEDKAT